MFDNIFSRKSFGGKKLFGENISPNCDYCRYSTQSSGGKPVCSMGCLAQESGCSKFFYDPLKREPKPAPNIPEFSAEDFKL